MTALCKGRKVTSQCTNPASDARELKLIEDWAIQENLKSVLNIVDVSSFGGPTRAYRVRIDPDKLIAYGPWSAKTPS